MTKVQYMFHQDDEEEEEDIDDLVNIHRQKYGDGYGSLRSSTVIPVILYIGTN